jgi:hypothetical protein
MQHAMVILREFQNPRNCSHTYTMRPRGSNVITGDTRQVVISDLGWHIGSVPPNKFRDSTSIRSRQIPSKSFPNHHSSAIQQCYSPDTDGVHKPLLITAELCNVRNSVRTANVGHLAFYETRRFRSPLLVPIQNQLNSVHALESYFFNQLGNYKYLNEDSVPCRPSYLFL